MPQFITEFINDPAKWNLDDPRYDWLTPEDRKALQRYPFDYGDVLKAEANFTPEALIPDYLGIEDVGQLDHYCQRLFHRSWRQIHAMLRVAARNDVVENVFMRYAQGGSASAMQIMANGVMKLNQEGEQRGLTIKIVNDIDGDE